MVVGGLAAFLTYTAYDAGAFRTIVGQAVLAADDGAAKARAAIHFSEIVAWVACGSYCLGSSPLMSRSSRVRLWLKSTRPRIPATSDAHPVDPDHP